MSDQVTKPHNHVEVDLAAGKAAVFSEPMIFHCNHYNRNLQQFIEDPGYVDSAAIFRRSSAETVYLQLREFINQRPQSTFEDVLRFASELFRFAGFGTLDFSGVSADGGVVVGEESHYGRALKLNVGERDEPGEFLDQGFIAGVLLAASHHLDLPLGNGFDIHQTESISTGDDVCRFEVDTDSDFQWLEMVRPNSVRTVPTAPPPDYYIPEEELEVDEAAIIEAVADLDLTGNEDGLIPAFGLYLTRNYADYYNKSSFRFVNEVGDHLGTQKPARTLLEETGHICGFHTFGGIMTSPEWEAVVQPQIETSRGWIHGMVAIINALGWGVWRVEELVPDERLVIRAYDCYESLGHLRWFGPADDPVEFLVQGGGSALMNLVYYGDIADREETTQQMYHDLFKDRGGFSAEFTHSIAAGDDYVRVEVSR